MLPWELVHSWAAVSLSTSPLLQRIGPFRGESLNVLRLAVEYVDDAGEDGAASPTLWLMHASIVCKSKAGTGVATRGDAEGGSGGGALDSIGGRALKLYCILEEEGGPPLCCVEAIGVGGGPLTIGASRASLGGSISIDFSGLSFAIILSSSQELMWSFQ